MENHLCFQLPALLSKGTALVVSPLIALMKNQVDVIRGISSNDGIAHVLNSSLNNTEKVKKNTKIWQIMTMQAYILLLLLMIKKVVKSRK